MGQAVSPKISPRSEAGVLPARLIVASFAAIIIGLLAAAITPDWNEDPAQAFTSKSQARIAPAASPQAQSDEQRAMDGSAPSPISGFAILSAAPLAEFIVVPRVTIADMMAIARPLPEAEQPDAPSETFELTLPLRKPLIKPKSKRQLTRRDRLSFGERLPWLR